MRRALFGIVASVFAVGCEDAQCALYPCPLKLAATLRISAANAPNGVAGITVSGSSGVVPCVTGATSVCSVYGGSGSYSFTVSAPGYAPTNVTAQVPGTDAGCNTCGSLDTQNISVVLTPSA